MNGLQPIPPLVALQTSTIQAVNKRGLSIWALSPAFVLAHGLGRQFVRNDRVVAEQWSIAQQAVLQWLDERVALVEAMTPSTADLKAETVARQKTDLAAAAETQARKDADALLRAGLDDERTGRLAGQQILANEVAALKARVAVLEAKPAPTLQLERGNVATVAVLLGGSTDLAITYVDGGKFPDTNYVIRPGVCSAVALGQVTITVKSRTTTGCVLTVRAAGVALAAGQVIDVIAYRFTA